METTNNMETTETNDTKNVAETEMEMKKDADTKTEMEMKVSQVVEEDDIPPSPYEVLQQISEEAVRVASEAIQNAYTSTDSPVTRPVHHRRVRSEVVRTESEPAGPMRSNSFQKWKSQMQKAFKGGARDEHLKTNFNPEILANQKRQWYQIHSKKLDLSGYKEPISMFEDFVVVGLSSDANLKLVEEAFAKRKTWELQLARTDVYDMRLLQSRGPSYPPLEPQVLFQYPPEKQLAIHQKELPAFCFPEGVKARLMERTPSMSDLNGVIHGQEHLGRDDLSFIFSLKGADNTTLYGVCLHVQEIVQRSPGIIDVASPLFRSSGGLCPFLISAPRCYCVLTRVPFFELHYEMLNSIVTQDRLNRITQFLNEMHITDHVPSENTTQDLVNDNRNFHIKKQFPDWKAFAIPVNSAAALTAAAAGIISDDEVQSFSSRSREFGTAESISTSEASDTSQAKETDMSEAKETDTSQAKTPDMSQAKETDLGQTKGTETGEAKETEASEAKEIDASEAKETEASEVEEIKTSEASEAKETEMSEAKETDMDQAKDTGLIEAKETYADQAKETDMSEAKEKETSEAVETDTSEAKEKEISETVETDTSEAKETDRSEPKETDLDQAKETDTGQANGIEMSEAKKIEVIKAKEIEIEASEAKEIEIETSETKETEVSEANEAKETEMSEAKERETREADETDTSEASEIDRREAKETDTSQAKETGMGQTNGTEMSEAKAIEASEAKGEDMGQAKETDTESKEGVQFDDDASETLGTHCDEFERMSGGYANGHISPELDPPFVERQGSCESIFSSVRSMGLEDEVDEFSPMCNMNAEDNAMMKWAKEHKNELLQIVCCYHALPLPPYGGEIVFQPLEHLQAIRYSRPAISSLESYGIPPDMDLLDSSGAAEVNVRLAAAEEAFSLSIWTTATICRVLSLESILALFAGVLLEKQVVVVCPNLGVLSSIVLSLIPMIHPFEWQSLLLPVLPKKIARVS